MKLLRYKHSENYIHSADEIAINPRYIKSVQACNKDTCVVMMEGYTQGIYIECSFERFLKDVGAA